MVSAIDMIRSSDAEFFLCFRRLWGVVKYRRVLLRHLSPRELKKMVLAVLVMFLMSGNLHWHYRYKTIDGSGTPAKHVVSFVVRPACVISARSCSFAVGRRCSGPSVLTLGRRHLLVFPPRTIFDHPVLPSIAQVLLRKRSFWLLEVVLGCTPLRQFSDQGFIRIHAR
jgi:hypothetical protein